MHLPAMVYFDSFNFYDSASLLSLSLGNLGFSQSLCAIESMEVETSEMSLKCASGTISKLEQFGITTIFEDQ
jgi:hypothetical protein